MNKEVIKQFGEDAIGGLAKNEKVRWFVDANVLIRGLVSELFDEPSRVFVLDKVRNEVRKRPEAIRGNKFVDAVEKTGNIVAEDWCSPDICESVRFLNRCAKELAPAIRANTQWFIDREGLDYATAESRAIERTAVEGAFFECDLKKGVAGAGLISEDDARVDKRTRKSWFEYPRKRREKIAAGEYQFTDELLVATSIAHSILKKEKVCILSVDKDIAAIMKQVADNWIWSASTVDCELTHGEAVFDDVVALWEKRCQDLEKHRQSCHARIAMRIIDEGVFDPAVLYEPIENEVVLCRPDDGHLGNFGFNHQMVDYARDVENIWARCRLIRKGWWIPRFT